MRRAPKGRQLSRAVSMQREFRCTPTRTKGMHDIYSTVARYLDCQPGDPLFLLRADVLPLVTPRNNSRTP